MDAVKLGRAHSQFYNTPKQEGTVGVCVSVCVCVYTCKRERKTVLNTSGAGIISD